MHGVSNNPFRSLARVAVTAGNEKQTFDIAIGDQGAKTLHLDPPTLKRPGVWTRLKGALAPDSQQARDMGTYRKKRDEFKARNEQVLTKFWNYARTDYGEVNARKALRAAGIDIAATGKPLSARKAQNAFN